MSRRLIWAAYMSKLYPRAKYVSPRMSYFVGGTRGPDEHHNQILSSCRRKQEIQSHTRPTIEVSAAWDLSVEFIVHVYEFLYHLRDGEVFATQNPPRNIWRLSSAMDLLFQ